MASKFTTLVLISGAVVCGLYFWYKEQQQRKQREEAIYNKLLRENGTSREELERRFKELQKNRGWVNKEEWDRLMGAVGIKDPVMLRQMWRHKGGTDEPDSRIRFRTESSSPNRILERIFDEHDTRKVGKIDFEEFAKVLQVRALELENKQITIEDAERIAVEVLASLGKDKTYEITRSEFYTFFLGDSQIPQDSINDKPEDELKIDDITPEAMCIELEEKQNAPS